MRKPLLFISLALFFSCSQSDTSDNPKSGNILENLSYAVDTVVVDPGEEIINLSMDLYYSDVSKDKKWLYHFDSENTHINAIDLENLSLDHTINFDKEGPDGVGSYISSIQALADENFLITTFRSSGIFNNQGKKVEDVTIKPNEYAGIEGEDEVELAYMLTSSEEQEYLFSLPGDFMVSGRDLLKLDKASKTGIAFDIPKLDLTAHFTLIKREGEFAEISMEDYFLEEFDKNLYISSSVTSEVYKYAFRTDSLSFYSFPQQIVPKKKTEFPIKEVSGDEEYKEQRNLVLSQITYSTLLRDKSRNLFFRIGSTVKASDVPEGKPSFEVYLIAFDDSMALVGETKIKNLKSIPSYPFFKDGKLYSYVNVEDELGFAVFTFNF